MKNTNYTSSQEGQGQDLAEHEGYLAGNDIAQDEHEGHNHALHDNNRHTRDQHEHDHPTDTMYMDNNSSLPLHQYPGYASTHHNWSVGSWLSSLWPFNHHGQQHGGLAGTLPEVGQDAAQQVPREHLVFTP